MNENTSSRANTYNSRPNVQPYQVDHLFPGGSKKDQRTRSSVMNADLDSIQVTIGSQRSILQDDLVAG